MTQPSLLAVGTSNLRKMRIKQEIGVNKFSSVKEIIFYSFIDVNKLTEILDTENKTYDIGLIHSGNYLYPTVVHPGHVCLLPWDVEKVAKHIDKIVKILKKWVKVIMITESHPRVVLLKPPFPCLPFTPWVQKRFNILQGILMVRFSSDTKICFLTFEEQAKKCLAEKNLPSESNYSLHFSKQYLNLGQVHLTREGNNLLRAVLTELMLKEYQSFV